MANDYVTNGAISQPIFYNDIKADVDLGGLKFSYQYGVFYDAPSNAELPVKFPPSFTDNTQPPPQPVQPA